MISVHETEELSLPQIEEFLAAAKEVRFEARERKQIYRWIDHCWLSSGRDQQRAQSFLGTRQHIMLVLTGLSLLILVLGKTVLYQR